MIRPACDGSFITHIAASTEPTTAAGAIRNNLLRYPGSSYLRTDQTCPSLRAATDEGNPIYVVFFGPFSTRAAACVERAQGPADSYVKILDTSSPPAWQEPC